MLPRPTFSMCGTDSWLMMNAEVTHQSKVLRKSSSVICRNGA